MKTVDIKKTSRNILSKCAEKGYTVKMIQEELRLSYTDPLGKRRYIYSNSLVVLREREEKLVKDQLAGLNVYKTVPQL